MPNSTSTTARGFLLWLGLALLCLGVYITATLWFLFLFSAPLALAGLVLILLSRQPAWRILLAIMFPFVGWAGLATGAWATAPREQGITFLIPEGYEGTIMVVKGEQCAPPPELEAGRHLYRVPASGLLIVRDTVPNRQHPYYSWPNKGYFLRPDNQYFVVDRQGRRLRELTEVRHSYEPDGNPEATSSLFGQVGRNEVAAFYDEPIGSAPASLGSSYAFQYVTITTQNRYDQPINYNSQNRVRALADSLVPRCRIRIGQLPQGLRTSHPHPFDGPVSSLTPP